jgi:hypothetical protein
MYGDLFSVVTSAVTMVNLYTETNRFWSAPLIFSCFAYDLVLGTPDKCHVVHHTVSIMMMIVYYKNYTPFLDHVARVVLTTEMSVPFYIFVPYVKKWPVVSALNYGLFLGSFFWTRVFNMYVNLFRNPELLTLTAEFKIFYLLYVLMGLNFYWAAKIIRIACKPFDHASYTPLCHRVVSYMYFGNALLIYHVNGVGMDFYVNGALSLSSFAYHQMAITPNGSERLCLYVDNALIHLRCLVPIFFLLETHYTFLITLNHAVMWVAFVRTENYNYTYFGALVDIVVLAFILEGQMRSDLATCLYGLGLCVTIEPLRRMTHLSIHALLWWLSYLIARAIQDHTLYTCTGGLCQ